MHKEVMKITENVENPDTHLKHGGDIEIKGDVAGGSTVEAGGDIYVDNVAGSQLIAGGNIRVKNHVFSFKSNDSVLYAKGSVRAVNISDANIAAEGEVCGDNAVNSTIYSNDRILIRGNVSGSKVVALKNVEIGSTECGDGGVTVESGRSAIIDDKITSYYNEKKTLLNRMENVLRYLQLVSGKQKKEKLQKKADEIDELIKQIETFINELTEYSRVNSSCGIKIYNTAAAGTCIVMKGARITLDKNLYKVQFTEQNGNIVTKIL